MGNSSEAADKTEFRRLRRFNAAMCILHLGQAAAIFALPSPRHRLLRPTAACLPLGDAPPFCPNCPSNWRTRGRSAPAVVPNAAQTPPFHSCRCFSQQPTEPPGYRLHVQGITEPLRACRGKPWAWQHSSRACTVLLIALRLGFRS